MQARNDLLDALDRLSGESHIAKAIAADIRRTGRNLDYWVAWAAWHSAQSHGAWLRFDPVVAALADYEKAANGVDLAGVRSLDQRRREAADAARARIAEIQARQAAAVARLDQRTLLGHLGTVRSEQHGGIVG